MRIDEDGNVIFCVSPINFIHYIAVSFALLLVTIHSVLNWSWSVQWVTIGGILLPLPLFALPFLAMLATTIVKIYNERLILTKEYLLFVQGIVSWKQASVRMDYSSIRQVGIDENILQRILGVGDIRCSTVASAEKQDITMVGVRDPRKVKDLINERVRGHS